jgi:hypothetical protein
MGAKSPEDGGVRLTDASMITGISENRLTLFGVYVIH